MSKDKEPALDILEPSPLSPSNNAFATYDDDDDDPLINATIRSRTSSSHGPLPSPSTDTTPSVRSLTLSPEEGRNSTSRRPPPTPTRPTSSTAALVGQSLASNTMFYDIPVNDAFSELLERFVPPEQRQQRDTQELEKKGPDVLANLVMNNRWRSVARYARRCITQSNPADLEQILKLWFLRLLALIKLGLFQLASAELDKLGDLKRSELTYAYYGNQERTGSMVPFELWILWARLPAWLKYPLVSLERLTMLAVECKKQASNPVWRHREGQVYLILATHMMEMNDFSSASSIMTMVLERFGTTADGHQDIDILSGLSRLYLELGDVSTAEKLHTTIENEAGNGSNPTAEESIQFHRALLRIAKGEWAEARNILQHMIGINKNNLLVMNNLAVCEVYLGNLDKAIALLETMTQENPTSAGTCETAIFNMCTLYELRFDPATQKKVEVMKKAARWVGDSFQVECVKLQ